MTLDVLQHTFGIKTHFLEYLELLNALPTNWKKKLENGCEENETKYSVTKINDTQNISRRLDKYSK